MYEIAQCEKELRIGLVALAVGQKATVTVFSDFWGGKSRANAFWRNSLIRNLASHVFLLSEYIESVLKVRFNEELIKIMRASLTIASTRKMRPVTGLACASPAPVSHFRSRLALS